MTPVGDSRSRDANALLRQLSEAHQILQACLVQLEEVLAKPAFNAGALTSVRLKLAGVRLTRGPLVTSIAEFLAGNVTEAEETMLAQLRASHHRLLQTATMHTSKWTLDAIAANWGQYRRETRELMREWSTKADREQRLICPLVQRWA